MCNRNYRNIQFILKLKEARLCLLIRLPVSAKKKTAKKSGKEKASNAPDWAKRQKYDKNKSADSEAGRVLDEKYGKGKLRKGADSEFSKIKKWLQRDKGFK